MNEIHHYGISDEIDWLKMQLSPLKQGMPVALTLELPEKPKGKKMARKSSNSLITLVPGMLFGFRTKSVVVSVLGKGSCLVQTDEKKIAGLVLSGIPSRLATVLMDKLFDLYME